MGIYLILSYLTLFHQTPYYSVLSCPVLSCPVLSCPVLSCPVLTWPDLTCPVLSCPILSYPVVLSSHLFSSLNSTVNIKLETNNYHLIQYNCYKNTPRYFLTCCTANVLSVCGSQMYYWPIYFQAFLPFSSTVAEYHSYLLHNYLAQVVHTGAHGPWNYHDRNQNVFLWHWSCPLREGRWQHFCLHIYFIALFTVSMHFPGLTFRTSLPNCSQKIKQHVMMTLTNQNLQ